MKKNSYAKIMKSTSIMGGAAIITLIMGMMRTKFAAMIIGANGVGILAGLMAIQGFFCTLASLGMQSSAVREVALAVNKGDNIILSRVVVTLSRINLLSGIAGVALIILLSKFLSKLTFEDEGYIFDVSILGCGILFANLAGGHIAQLQGMSRVKEIAIINVLSAIFSTFCSVLLYYVFGLRGLSFSLVCISIIQYIFSSFFTKKIHVSKVFHGWGDTFRESEKMIKLGILLMWNSLMVFSVSYLSIAYISAKYDVKAVGIYSAAYALSGVFVNFVLNAMGTEYYPKLTSMIESKVAMNQFVSEQSEIGVLLALPGVVGTMLLSTYIVQLFYTSEFLPAAVLLQWFLLGCLCRVIAWPLGFLMLALGKNRWFFITETGFNFFHLVLMKICLDTFGLEGVAVAFFMIYVIYSFVVYCASYRLTKFKWSKEFQKILFKASVIISVAFSLSRLGQEYYVIGGEILLFSMVVLYSLNGLVTRVGDNYGPIRLIKKIPLINVLLLKR